MPYLVGAPPCPEDDGATPSGSKELAPGWDEGLPLDCQLDPVDETATSGANLAQRLLSLAEVIGQVRPSAGVLWQPACSDTLNAAAALALSRAGIPFVLITPPSPDAVGGYSTDGMTTGALASAILPATADPEALIRTVEALLAPPAQLPGDRAAEGRTFGTAEATAVVQVLRTGTLNSTAGTEVHGLERDAQQLFGRRHAVACASGSAAVHCAIAALGLSAGDEVITTPITDMGALTPILYEGAVPVFADVDPRSLNCTAATIQAQWTDRTRAVIATHLFGLPAEMGPIRDLCASRGVPLVEDAAQAFLAGTDQGDVGSFGSLACYSLQQGKHMTCGEGGLVTCDDPDLARGVRLAVNKSWPYGEPNPDHRTPALNQRMTELQGAVAKGQLARLPQVVAARREVACQLFRAMEGLPGLELPHVPDGWRHSFWKLALRVDPAVHPGGPDAVAQELRALGIPAAPRYIRKPAFECGAFLDPAAHPVTALPIQASTRPPANGPAGAFGSGEYPGARQGLAEVLVLPINERWRDAHIEWLASQLRTAAEASAAGSRNG